MVKYSVIEPMSSPEEEPLQPGRILKEVFNVPALDRVTDPRRKNLYFGIVGRKKIDQWNDPPC
jgi:hypothetical protein